MCVEVTLYTEKQFQGITSEYFCLFLPIAIPGIMPEAKDDFSPVARSYYYWVSLGDSSSDCTRLAMQSTLFLQSLPKPEFILIRGKNFVRTRFLIYLTRLISLSIENICYLKARNMLPYLGLFIISQFA